MQKKEETEIEQAEKKREKFEIDDKNAERQIQKACAAVKKVVVDSFKNNFLPFF